MHIIHLEGERLKQKKISNIGEFLELLQFCFSCYSFWVDYKSICIHIIILGRFQRALTILIMNGLA